MDSKMESKNVLLPPFYMYCCRKVCRVLRYHTPNKHQYPEQAQKFGISDRFLYAKFIEVNIGLNDKLFAS